MSFSVMQLGRDTTQYTLRNCVNVLYLAGFARQEFKYAE